MIYKLTNKEQKTSAKGTVYTSATLTDEQGNVYNKINAFRGEFNGEEAKGTLVKNGEFWNFEAETTYTGHIPQSKPNYMAQNMRMKAENIEEAQDRREKGVAHAGSITNATNLTIAMINAGIIPSTGSEQDVLDAVTKYAKWYYTKYTNPSNSDDIPF